MSFDLELEQSRMIQFDEEKHAYTVDGVVRPGVTSILGDLGVAESFDGVNEALLKSRAARGKRIHKAVELYNKGLLDLASVHEEDRPFVDGYIKFTQDFPGWKSIMQERSFYVKCFDDPERGELGYCGMIDDIMAVPEGKLVVQNKTYNVMPGTIALIDDKTSASIVPSYRFQVGGGYLKAIVKGVDGQDLDTPLRTSISTLAGFEVTKVLCFIRHLRAGHYFLIPVPEEESYAMWEKMLQKYFYPQTKIDIVKMVKDQRDIPEGMARRLVRTKLLKDGAEAKYKSCAEEAVTMLTENGISHNGVAEIGGYRVTLSKGQASWKESIDEAAFIKAILSTPQTQTMTGKEITDLYASFKRGYEVDGTWTRRVTKIKDKTVDAKPDTSAETKPSAPAEKPIESKPSPETNLETSAGTNPEISGNSPAAQQPEKKETAMPQQENPATSGNESPAGAPKKTRAKRGEGKKKEERPAVDVPKPAGMMPVPEPTSTVGSGVPMKPSATEGSPQTVAATTTPPAETATPRPAPDDFNESIPADLAKGIEDLANQVFPMGMARAKNPDGSFAGWMLSKDARAFIAEALGGTIAPFRALTEGQCKDIRSALHARMTRKEQYGSGSKTALLTTQLIVEVMGAYKITELEAKQKIAEFCTSNFGRADYLSFDEPRMREVINKMGAAMANELLVGKHPLFPKEPEKKEEPAPVAAPVVEQTDEDDLISFGPTPAPAPKPANAPKASNNTPDF